jgi:endoglucanase
LAVGLAGLGLPQALLAAVSADIKVNSVGYLPNRVKRASITNAGAASAWNLRQVAGGAIVASGSLSGPVTDTDFGYGIWTADFTAYTGSGDHYLEVPGLGQSAPFRIAPDAYNESLRLHMLGFYGMRCGTAVSFMHDSYTYSHAACHLGDGYHSYTTPGGVVTGGVHRDGTGGWHDAGDYNKYTVNTGVTVGSMLQAWEDFKPGLEHLNLPFLPEAGGTFPDFLDEIKWELDWVLKMQYGPGDGRVYHKLSAVNFNGFVLPEYEGDPRYFVHYGSAATADFTAMLAKAYRAYLPYDAVYAQTLLDAALVSYAWLQANPGHVAANQSGFNTGAYGTSAGQDAGHRLWAAAEVWESSGDAAALTDLEARITAANPKTDADWDWANPRNLGFFTYARSQRAGRSASLVTAVNTAIKNAADSRVGSRNISGYGRTLKGSYYWGSNGSVARSALVLHTADRLFPNDGYWDTAVDQLSFLYGRNHYNRSQVTGEGWDPPLYLHHRPSGGDANPYPWPGLLSGGGTTATNWVDEQNSYETNENAINWGGAMVYLLAMLAQPVPAPGTPTPSPTISPTHTITPTPTPLPCGDAVVHHRVRAAAGAFVDGTGDTWVAQQAYSAGGWGFVGGNAAALSVSPIAGTLDDGLYQAERWGNPVEFRFTLPNGFYQVTLKLAETYHVQAGRRVFSVQAEGETKLSNLDIVAEAGGPYTALDRSFTVNVADGVLNLLGIAAVDNAKFGSIMIEQLFSGPCPTPTSSPTISPTHSITPTFTDSPTISPTHSITPTFSVSPSFTVSPTITETYTASPSPTPSPTASPTATPTATPENTGTATITLTFTVSPTVTPPALGEPPQVLQAVPLPHPVRRPLLRLKVELDGPADALQVDLFSAAYTRVVSETLSGIYLAGWNQIVLPLPGLPPGLYFAQLRAQALGREGPPGKSIRLFIIP